MDKWAKAGLSMDAASTGKRKESGSSSSSDPGKGKGKGKGKASAKKPRAAKKQGKGKGKGDDSSRVAESLRRMSRSDIEAMVMASVESGQAITASEILSGAPELMVKGAVASKSSFDATNQVGLFGAFDEDMMNSIFTSLNTKERLAVTTVVCSGWLALRGSAEYWKDLNLADLGRTLSATAFNRLLNTIPLTHTKSLRIATVKDNIGPDYKDLVNLFKNNEMGQLTSLDLSGPRITNMVIKEVGKKAASKLKSLTVSNLAGKPEFLFEIIKLAPVLTKLSVSADIHSPEAFLTRLSAMAELTRGEGSSSLMTDLQLTNSYSFYKLDAEHLGRMGADFPELETFAAKGVSLYKGNGYMFGPIQSSLDGVNLIPFARLTTLKITDIHASPAFGWGEKTHEVTEVVDVRCDNFFAAIFGAAPALLTLEARHATKYVSGKDYKNGVRTPPNPLIKLAHMTAPTLVHLTLSHFHIVDDSFDEFSAPALKYVSLTHTERESGRYGGYGSSAASAASSGSSSSAPKKQTPAEWLEAKFGSGVRGTVFGVTVPLGS